MLIGLSFTRISNKWKRRWRVKQATKIMFWCHTCITITKCKIRIELSNLHKIFKQRNHRSNRVAAFFGLYKWEQAKIKSLDDVMLTIAKCSLLLHTEHYSKHDWGYPSTTSLSSCLTNLYNSYECTFPMFFLLLFLNLQIESVIVNKKF